MIEKLKKYFFGLTQQVEPTEELQLTTSERDSVDLIRDRYALVDTSVPLFEDLDTESQNRLLDEAHQIYLNPSFRKILHYLLRRQEQYISRESLTWDSVMLGRGSINGILLIEEEFANLSTMKEESMKKEEFNKHDLI